MPTIAKLSHIKEKPEDGREPWDPQPAPKSRRIAWPGGKMSSNKDQALAAFLQRKLAQGEALSEAQQEALATACKGTQLEGKSEAECFEASRAAPKPPRPTKSPRSASKKRGAAKSSSTTPSKRVASQPLAKRLDSSLSCAR